MDLISLQATLREAAKGVTHELRRKGFLPVVLYGQGVKSRALAVPIKEIERILARGAGRNTLIKLEVEGDAGGEPPTVIIKDLQRDPVRGRYVHADLLQISLKEKIKARIRIHLIGEEAVAKEGGIVQHQMREVEVECLPTALPDHITVDLAGKGIGDSVTLAQLAMPEGVRLLGEPNEVVASIVAPKMVAVEEPAEGEPAEGGERGETGEGEEG
jgi:large subunit ribosomal protein L25